MKSWMISLELLALMLFGAFSCSSSYVNLFN